ncbi:MAG TPA: MBL fold metallo-hydrolase [Acidobacteriota bacterium]|nr:MBL fold metallo-hydrolase [Acidobacteriota bacterium]
MSRPTICALLAALCSGASAPQTTLTIEYIAHASFLVESPGGARILLDPFASGVWIGYDFPEGLHPDAVVITHPHYDHDAGRFRGTPFPWPEARVFDAPGEFMVDDVRLIGLRGRHADPYGEEFGQRNTIWVVETAGLRIAHLGDNGPLTCDNLRDLGAVDILMVPIDAQFHILARDEVAALVTAVQPRHLVPMHYRLPELEPDPDSPDDLGSIEPWLQGRSGVVRLGAHQWRVGLETLLPAGSTIVFEPSPRVARPSR